ncbi:hypothetical protein G6F24_015862 [Rhizopus arrhizus]|nr:hypothetical protein G6F24_015862 [Rhizopus arrhizus]
MPPNSAGVNGRPLASTTVAPAGADRPLSTARMMPPCTSTSAFCRLPRALAVCPVALRTSRSCACADAEMHASTMAVAPSQARLPFAAECSHCLSTLISAPPGQAGNRNAAAPPAHCGRTGGGRR